MNPSLDKDLNIIQCKDSIASMDYVTSRKYPHMQFSARKRLLIPVYHMDWKNSVSPLRSLMKPHTAQMHM